MRVQSSHNPPSRVEFFSSRGDSPASLSAYDLDFDRVALSPKLTREEKIRLLVLMRHAWFQNAEREGFFAEEISPTQLEIEIERFRPEIEKRLAA
jgi:hypothetical protein